MTPRPTAKTPSPGTTGPPPPVMLARAPDPTPGQKSRKISESVQRLRRNENEEPPRTKEEKQTMKKTPPAYYELKRRTLHKIEAYHSDLLMHDRRAMREDPSTPFIHATGKMGTYMLKLQKAETYPAAGEYVPYCLGRSNREGILGQFAGMVDCYIRTGHPTLHHYDGKGKIREVTADQAKEIVREYVAQIRADWKKTRAA